MKRYKYITIKQENDEICNDHALYRILNNGSGYHLGDIAWYPQWHCYVFSATSDRSVFNRDCLNDIIDFIDNHAEK